MDAAVFVLSADPPVSASERELMTRVAGGSVRMFVVLNKADYLAGGELAEAVGFTGQVAGEAAGRPVRVYPRPARAALDRGGDPGSRRSTPISSATWTAGARLICAVGGHAPAGWPARSATRWP